MIKHTLLCSAIILSGCASTQFDTSTQFDFSSIDGKEFTFAFHIADEIKPSYKGLHVYDEGTNTHHIWLVKPRSTGCLEHEVLHGLFGKWHEGRDSMEYCSR